MKLHQELEALYTQAKHQDIITKITAIPQAEWDLDMVKHLARAYNNEDDFDQAVDVLDLKKEEGKQDAHYHYIYAYAYLYKEEYSNKKVRLASLKTSKEYIKKAIKIDNSNQRYSEVLDEVKDALSQFKNHDFWGRVDLDWCGYTGEKWFESPVGSKNSKLIIFGEDEEVDFMLLDDEELNDFKTCFGSFLIEQNQVFEQIKSQTFERFKSIYEEHIETEITDADDHASYLGEMLYFRILSKTQIIISYNYEIDTEHGLEILIENNQVKQIAGIGEVIIETNNTDSQTPESKYYEDFACLDRWNTLGEKYAKSINAMIQYADENGWEAWDKKGEPEPKEERADMRFQILELLKEANENGTVNQFRENFPPSREPFVSMLREKALNINNISVIDNQTLCYCVRNYENEKYVRQYYLLENQKITKLDSDIQYISKSKKEQVFLILKNDIAVTTKGWQGNKIAEFGISETLEIEKIEPSNDGRKLIVASSNHGAFLFTETDEKYLFPRKEMMEKSEIEEIYLNMFNMTFSNNNEFIVMGSQDYDHDIFDNNGDFLGQVGPQSSYPHFCIFSADDQQLITNSCHFYNGVTIGVAAEKLKGIHIEAWEESDDFINIDEVMRVYDGVALDDYYILGDANGYIRALNKKGKLLWQHFIGSSIGSIALSDDNKYLFVSTYAGILVKLEMNRAYRDSHTIGTADLYEHFRIMMWKDEQPLFW
ncbi:MAG: hypothetical protein ACPG6V_02275 [Flavobacteriales bacterium]